jgi:hypothetical protein
MRILSRTVALLAVSGCMSNTARVDKNIAPSEGEVSSVASPIVEESKAEAPASGTQPLNVKVEAPAPTEVTSECDALKKDITLPYFIKETSALVVGIDQTCKENKETNNQALSLNMSVIGVACTGSPGFITRKGHSNQNWEVVSFGMDLGCNMHPPEEIKTVGKKKLGIESDPRIVSFVPMMIEYWEFENNNDAGLGSIPTLTANGGGAAQWKKDSIKNSGFPIKLYGHSSTLAKDQAVYEARAVLMPRSNQRQFQVLVQEMKLLSDDELKLALDRCLSKTNSRAACSDAFENQ